VAHRAVLKQSHYIRRYRLQIAGAAKASTLYHKLEGTSKESRLIAWLALDDERARQQLLRFESQLRDVTPRFDGHRLKEEFQLPPGPIFKTIIDRLREARLDGEVTTLEEERALVKQLLQEASNY
jgi:tRNA nucleotidyltransferase (CCA-adding enzyme)